MKKKDRLKIVFRKEIALFFYIGIFSLSSLDAVVHNVATEAQLVTAINASNLAGPADSIIFTANITLTGPLPAVTNTYLINGNGQTLDGGSANRGFLVLGAGTNPTVQNLTIQNVQAKGGNGGDAVNVRGGSGGGGLGAGAGIYAGNGASPIINSVTFNNCDAVGGGRSYTCRGII